MLIAQQKREENIAEYLLYMWQVEDLMRACQLDLDKVDAMVIQRFGIEGEERTAVRQWYGELIDMMHGEGVAQCGHLRLTSNVLQRLTELHNELINDPEQAPYQAHYFHTLPSIVMLRSKSGQATPPSEVESCFNALYGVMLLRMQGKTIDPATTEAITQITELVRRLTKAYHSI